MNRSLKIGKSPEKGLREGWKWSTIGEVCSVFSGNPAPQGSEFFEEGSHPFVRVQDMGKLGHSTRIIRTADSITKKAIPKMRLFPKGTILFTKSGASTLLNQRAILGKDMYVVSHIACAIPPKEMSSEWVYYWLKTVDFNLLAHATTLPSLPLAIARVIPIPVAPTNEQKQIVAEIEKQFSRLDEAVASLKRAKANLKRYKAAVLKAAVEGKLTEQWRKEHPDVEPAEKFLQRILTERRAKWEKAEIGKLRANGNPLKKVKRQRGYNEPISPNISELPLLPKSWTWASVDQLADGTSSSIIDGPFGSNLKTVHYTQSGPRVIRLQNIGDAEFINEKAHIAEEHFNQLMRHSVEAGDVIIAALGSPAPRACLVPDWLGKAIVKADCVRLRPNHGYLESGYLMYALNSDSIQSMTEKIVHGIGRPRLNLGEIKSIPLPIPPKIEQKKILQEIEHTLSMIRKIEELLETNFERAERLRQSILKRAFSGKLVPQDPNDEPAAVLLERIRLQKEKGKGSGKGDKIE